MNELPVKNPLKWDAEHPNLYTLTVTLSKDGKEIGRFDRRIGFRDVKIEKDRMLVNGMPVKLRGACRHDIHPTLGRTTTAELDSLDVILFKRSNMNFVRTSHYPPTERFLEVLRPLRHLCGERDGCLFRRYLPAEELCARQDAGQCRVYAPLSLAMPRDGEVVPFPSLHPVTVDRQ